MIRWIMVRVRFSKVWIMLMARTSAAVVNGVLGFQGGSGRSGAHTWFIWSGQRSHGSASQSGSTQGRMPMRRSVMLSTMLVEVFRLWLLGDPPLWPPADGIIARTEDHARRCGVISSEKFGGNILGLFQISHLLQSSHCRGNRGIGQTQR